MVVVVTSNGGSTAPTDSRDRIERILGRGLIGSQMLVDEAAYQRGEAYAAATGPFP